MVCAQLFPTKRKLDISISDCGIGIGAFSQSLDLKDDNDAISKALERGVTRDAQVRQGNGMAGSLEIMKEWWKTSFGLVRACFAWRVVKI